MLDKNNLKCYLCFFKVSGGDAD